MEPEDAQKALELAKGVRDAVLKLLPQIHYLSLLIHKNLIARVPRLQASQLLKDPLPSVI